VNVRRRVARALRWLAGQLDDQRRPVTRRLELCICGAGQTAPSRMHKQGCIHRGDANREDAAHRPGVAFARHVCGTLLSGLPHTTVACGSCGGSTVLGDAHPSTLLAPVIPLRDGTP
jgi:hypothetical protein